MTATKGTRLIDISEVAKIFMSSIETMRKYKKLKIIEPIKTIGRKDIFDYAEVREIKELIDNYRLQGKSLKEITSYLMLRKCQTTTSITGSKRILIIDDDITLLNVLEDLLQDHFNQAEMEIVSATNGEEAIQLATISHFDIIVIDIGLPGDIGTRVHKKLKMIPNTSGAKYLFMSGLLQYEETFPDFIQKPFKPSEFIKAINRMLGTVST